MTLEKRKLIQPATKIKYNVYHNTTYRRAKMFVFLCNNLKFAKHKDCHPSGGKNKGLKISGSNILGNGNSRTQIRTL